MNFKDIFQQKLSENINTHLELINIEHDIDLTIKTIFSKIRKGGKILLCGNGGSAADAQHLAAEFLIRLRPQVNRQPLPAISLAQDTSTLTACGNDFSFNDIFLRPFKALANNNDILVCISTSGNSKNIVNVLKEAKKRKIFTVCFLGNKGGKAKKFSNLNLIVNSNITARIQECHIFLGHIILEHVEDMFLKYNKNKNKNI